MIRAVFFDAVGTVLHSREPAVASYATIARRFGADVDERALAAAFLQSLAQAPALAFGLGHDAAELRRMEREWWRRLVLRTFDGVGRPGDFDAFFDELFAFFAEPGNWRADADAAALLEELRSRGLMLGVISNFDHRLYRVLKGLALDGYFESVTISSEAGWAKPSPEIFRVALGRHSLSSDDAIHVGDSETFDMDGARSAGLGAVLVDPASAKPLVADGRCVRARSLAQVAAAVDMLGVP